MGNLFEIFCNSLTNSYRLPLSSFGVTESARFVGLKCFLKWSRIFSRWKFPRICFQSCFLLLGLRKVSLVLCWSQIDWSWQILFQNLASSLVLFRVFDCLLGLAFWAICWSFKSYGSFNMIPSCHGWYNHVFLALVMFLQ